LKEYLSHAEELKLEGNAHFKAKQWNEALVSYRTGLARLAPRKGPGKEKEKPKTEELDPPSDDEGEAIDRPQDSAIHESEDVEELEWNDEGQAECAKARAVMNANIGACHVKLVSFFALPLEFTWNLAARETTKRQLNHAQKVNVQVTVVTIWLIFFTIESA
jgi:hypothetical protein